MKKFSGILLLTMIGIVTVVGPVLAAAWGPSSSISTGSTDVRFWGDTQTFIIDPDSATDPGGTKDLYDGGFLYISPTLLGMATSHPNDTGGRGELLLDRAGTGSTQDASNAWMTSSGGAQVKVESGGDVVITLGD